MEATTAVEAEPAAPVAAATPPGGVTNVNPRVEDSNNDKTLGKAPLVGRHRRKICSVCIEGEKQERTSETDNYKQTRG